MSAPSSPFRVPVGDLLSDPGRRRVVPIEADAGWSLELSRLATPVRGEFTLEGISGGVFLRGALTTELVHTCNRCLTEWGEEAVVDVAEMIGGEGSEYSLDDDVADLEQPLRDAVLLGLPMLPLCRPACRGLCATCGADLNTGACPGHEDAPEGPFSVLRELLEP